MGLPDEVGDFLSSLSDTFYVYKISTVGTISLNGCKINCGTNSDSKISLSMTDYMNKLKALELTRARKKQIDFRVTERERS